MWSEECGMTLAWLSLVEVLDARRGAHGEAPLQCSGPCCSYCRGVTPWAPLASTPLNTERVFNYDGDAARDRGKRMGRVLSHPARAPLRRLVRRCRETDAVNVPLEP